MSEWWVLVILFGVGALMLTAEVFIPSHGALTVAGLGFLIVGIFKTFSYAGRDAGIIAIFACVVFVPVLAVFAVKFWPKTPIGRLIAPPNPVITAADTSVPVEELNRLIGRSGRALTPLRPVGICEFNGKRVSCVAEFGMVEAGRSVEAIRISGANVAVQEKTA
jgi:membrane-bound serine protease (ClpP class)